MKTNSGRKINFKLEFRKRIIYDLSGVFFSSSSARGLYFSLPGEYELLVSSGKHKMITNEITRIYRGRGGKTGGKGDIFTVLGRKISFWKRGRSKNIIQEQ